MKKIVFIVFMFLLVLPENMFAGGINDNAMKVNWKNPAMSYCLGSNMGNAVIGNKKSVCKGGKIANCQLGDDYGTLMMVARDVNANGAKFCVTTVYGDRNKRGPGWTLYAEPAQGTKCIWLCKNGYTGEGCQSTTVSGCDSTLLKSTDFDGYSMSRSVGVESSIYMFHWDEQQGCGMNSYLEHDMVLGISDWLPSGHGAVAQAFVVRAGRGAWKEPVAWVEIWPVGEKTVVCKNGYKPNTANTDCEAIDENECAKSQMCSGWNSGAFNQETMIMEYTESCANDTGSTGGYIYKCKEAGKAFVSATDKTCADCATNLRGGISPQDGTCVKCDLGKIFNSDAASSNYCVEARALTKTDLQYGSGKTKNSLLDLGDQCWTISDPEEYKNCVKGIK